MRTEKEIKEHLEKWKNSISKDHEENIWMGGVESALSWVLEEINDEGDYFGGFKPYFKPETA